MLFFHFFKKKLRSYGAIDNSWLLQSYGFVDENNGMDSGP
jgi:hypothetical protein